MRGNPMIDRGKEVRRGCANTTRASMSVGVATYLSILCHSNSIMFGRMPNHTLKVNVLD